MNENTHIPDPEWRLERRLCELRLHDQQERIPTLTAKELKAFIASVEARGVRVPIEITPEGVVLDGRARLHAAEEAGLEQVPVRLVAPDDELEYMLRAALERRQLSASQAAALTLELEQHQELRAQARERQRANLRQNAEVATLPPRGEKSRETIARVAGCSPRTVQDAATVQAHDPELFEQIKQGKIGAETAARRVRRAQRDRQLPPAPPLPGELCELFYVDPPWQMGNPDGPHAPEQHYPTMPLEAIKALQLPAAKQAVLFLWAVNSLLPQALEVIEAWGFEYQTNIAWVKPSIGMGRWTRSRHELLLIARRGNHPAPDPEDLPDSVIEAKRGRHSEKPALFYELIERLYPTASKLELFARGTPRPGWAAWGNQVHEP